MSSDQTATVVVAAVIVQDGMVLIKQRKGFSNPENVGKWELPGGIVHFGEPFDLALRREVKEELNLGIRVDRLLHSQINTYSDGIDYLVLYYACTFFGTVKYFPESGVMFVEPSKVVSPIGYYNMLPGTAEAVSKLNDVTALRSAFSFVQSDVTNQTPDETLHLMMAELGKVAECHHKSKRYGPTTYYSEANQKKETSDLISMGRMYCEQKGWDYEELMKFGEGAYLGRMEDLRKYGTFAKTDG